MKLNYKRTFFVGLAFFLICAFWQTYDTLVALTLTNKFGMNQTASGIIMALDNVLALFMLPLFGALSDRAKGKTVDRLGKRTPFILIGTIIAVVCFFGLSIMDAQQIKLVERYNDPQTVAEKLWVDNLEIDNPYYGVTDDEVDSFFDTTAEKGNLQDLYKGSISYWDIYLDASSDYTSLAAAEIWDYNPTITNPYYNKTTGVPEGFNKTEKEGKVQELCDTKEHFVSAYNAAKTAGSDLYKNVQAGVKSRLSSLYANYVVKVRNMYARQITAENPANLIGFIVLLLFVLFAMATFRSPAVALMPAVTIKPLRSKANGIINIMGVIGGSLILGLGMVLGTGKPINALMNYIPMVGITVAIMTASLVVFLLAVKEPKFVQEMEEETAKYGLDKEQDIVTDEKGHVHMGKKRLVSFIFLMASICLWFFGYNAITSKYSVYASQVLLVDYNTTLLIAQIAALIAFLPAGIVATKIGRKKTIMAGIVMLATAFSVASFLKSGTSVWIMNGLFVLAGVGWASINVNSLPMVVEMATGADVGKYTGFYYTASMAAQIVTPILSGALMDAFKKMEILFPYGAIFVALSFVTMIFVHHGDSKPQNTKGLEALADAEDKIENQA